ncbi:frataxin-like protein [Pigmentiphaga humi]|uniref:Iron-sulfur cluster assembly protein CyaY n=2 Tax=Pigmentiphaga humi TaxID=2478468 RepID=A0A3P4AYU4_9BURK|nr:frataxin-like protein [Pigmentiphaga humi]
MSDIDEIMNESEFLALAQDILDSIEQQADVWFEQRDIDIEGTRNGNVLTLTFEDGSQAVVNSQAPMQEMWVAARSGGFHYRLKDGKWLDTRSGEELAQALSRICSEQSGQPIEVEVPSPTR